MLPLGRYQLQFLAEEPAVFPAYSGSTWRGVLGHALKRTVCVTRAPRCAGCLLLRSCSYPYIFETPPPEGGTKMRRYNSVPHPYALDTRATDGGGFAAGETVELGLTLFGHGNRYLPYLIHALSRAGDSGVGQGRARLRLLEARQQRPSGEGDERIYAGGETLSPLPPTAPVSPPAPRRARLVLHTPLRLKRDERLVMSTDFQFADLFASLLRRASMLTQFHTDTPLETDFKGLMERARAVRAIRCDLHWRDWTRRSSRQKTTMQMGGLLGEILLEDADWAVFWPYLWLGQWMHAGKGATFGLGRYTVEPASL